ncbi:hypothetical protein [Blastococcus sp. TF02A-26]|uniref:hypothetical protein n=1 Tax=Blastococcus sp. TF02A-26 TaxID=2250577 RepID=UPI0013147A9A|nr:hypothetical protein [Blastococcus sp. TF02A-26]
MRCRNCHQIRTHEENQSWRHQLWMRLMTEVYMTSRRVVPYEQQFYEDLMTK